MDTVEKMCYIGGMRRANTPVRIKLRNPEKYGTKTAVIYRVDIIDYHIIFKKKGEFITKTILIGDFDISRKISKKDIPYWNEIIYKQNIKEIHDIIENMKKYLRGLWFKYDDYTQKLSDIKSSDTVSHTLDSKLR